MVAGFAVAALILLALALVALHAFTFWRARTLLRPVRAPLRCRPGDVGLDMEEVCIPSPRGALRGWYLPARNSCTLLCCHGINDNCGQWVERVASLHTRSGYGALLFDFAGHGESEGSLVTYGVHESRDIAAAVEYLRGRGDVNMDGLGILGLSLGAISATLAAAEMPALRVVVLESGFADLLHDIGVIFRRYTGLPAFPFADLIVFWGERLSGVQLAEIRPVRVIGQISPRPVYIISDLADTLAQEPYDGEHLYAAAGEPKFLWQLAGAPHVGAFDTAPEEWTRRVGEFLDTYLAAGVATRAAPARAPKE